MILAVNPSFTSTSLPTLLYGEFRDDLQGHLAPLVGLPVKWASKHSADLARWTEGYINDQMLCGARTRPQRRRSRPRRYPT